MCCSVIVVNRCAGYLLIVPHPVSGEHGVDSVVARLPLLDLIADMEGSSGGVEVQEGLDVREVVTEVGVSAGLADVVRVEFRAVVGRGLHCVTIVVSGQTGIVILLAGFS